MEMGTDRLGENRGSDGKGSRDGDKEWGREWI